MWKRVHFLFTPTLKEVHISAQWMRTSIKQWRSFCHLITYYVIFIVPYVFLCDWLRSRSGSFWRKKTFSLRTIKIILRLIISLLETLISFSLKLCLARKKIIIWHIFFQIHFPAHYYHNLRGIHFHNNLLLILNCSKWWYYWFKAIVLVHETLNRYNESDTTKEFERFNDEETWYSQKMTWRPSKWFVSCSGA